MTFYEFKIYCEETFASGIPYLRWGQYCVNKLHEQKPAMGCGYIAGSKMDPYFDDGKIPAFWSWVEEHWDVELEKRNHGWYWWRGPNCFWEIMHFMGGEAWVVGSRKTISVDEINEGEWGPRIESPGTLPTAAATRQLAEAKVIKAALEEHRTRQIHNILNYCDDVSLKFLGLPDDGNAVKFGLAVRPHEDAFYKAKQAYVAALDELATICNVCDEKEKSK